MIFNFKDLDSPMLIDKFSQQDSSSDDSQEMAFEGNLQDELGDGDADLMMDNFV